MDVFGCIIVYSIVLWFNIWN